MRFSRFLVIYISFVSCLLSPLFSFLLGTQIDRWLGCVGGSIVVVWLFVTLWTVAHQAPLSVEFPRQEYWSGCLFPSPEDRPDPEIEPVSPALAGRFFITEPPAKPPKDCISSFQFSRSAISDYLRPHESQHARPPCPSPTPGVHSNSCPSSQWCHPAISSSLSPSPPAPNSSQHQSLFQWVNSSHEVARVLEFQL